MNKYKDETFNTHKEKSVNLTNWLSKIKIFLKQRLKHDSMAPKKTVLFRVHMHFQVFPQYFIAKF